MSYRLNITKNADELLDRLVYYLIYCLKKNNVSNQERNVAYKKYWKCDSIRMDCVFTCINNKEYDKALDYIDKCIDLDYENQTLMKRDIDNMK